MRLKLEVAKKTEVGGECAGTGPQAKARDEKNVLAGKQQVKISIFKMVFWKGMDWPKKVCLLTSVE